MGRKIFLLLQLAMLGVMLGSCTREDLEPLTPGKLEVEEVTSVALLGTVANGMYEYFQATAYYGRDAIVLGEVRADNCLSNNSSNRFVTYNSASITDETGEASTLWSAIYKVIVHANFVISKENVSLEGDPEAQKAIVGEAYAVRALAHYDLLRFYGAMYSHGATEQGIPYVTDYPVVNRTPRRTPPDQVKDKLYADLDKAIGMMPSLTGSTAKELARMKMRMKTRMNRYAALALKARVALWYHDWDTALAAIEVLESANLFSIIPKTGYVASWHGKLNPNSIFELEFSVQDNHGIDGLNNIFQGDGYGDVCARPELRAIFEAGDVRGSKDMIDENVALRNEKPNLGFYLANLGKHVSFYSNNVLFRFEEVKLMKAEALFKNGKIADAATALNEVASQRGASAYPPAITEDDILNERRKELCFEGFRFDDLVRFGREIPEIPGHRVAEPVGGKLYAFPIPKRELLVNPNLKQNPGY